MILSDKDILARIKKGDLKIDPYVRKNIQPSTYDVTLSEKILVFENWEESEIDVKKPNVTTRMVKASEKKGFVIHPGEFILGATREVVTIPNDLAVKIEGRSSIGRLGLIVHATAGYIDPGFTGTVTLEITNISRLPIRVYPKMRIGQLAFHQMTSAAMNPYGSDNLTSKYQGQVDPTASRIMKDFKKS